MSFFLSVPLAALLFKVVVCFNAYTTIYMENLADFLYRTLFPACMVTSDIAQLQFERFSKLTQNLLSVKLKDQQFMLMLHCRIGTLRGIKIRL